MNLNKLLIFLLLIPLISLASAGLEIISPDNISIEKDYQIQKIIELNIKNTENIDFYNIKFEGNIIELTPFNLTSGQNKTVSARIITNEPFNGNLILRGDYETELGQSNKTEIVNIDYNYGIDKCNFEIIEGDSVKWVNNVLDEITLYNTETNQDFKTILKEENHTKKFESAMEFSYLAKRIGVPFTNICTIKVRDDTGFAHNSQYDAQIDANIKINYDPTEMNIEYLETNYTLQYNEIEEDFLKIKNIGSNPAKNIKLTADWFEFNENNFDLNSGYSKTISFKLNPEIFETNQTNKTHEINLIIEGNFDTINQTIYIFIPYKKIDNLFTDGSVDEEVIRNFFRFWCKSNPDDEICLRETTNLNGSTTTVQFSADAIKQLIERMARTEDEQETYKKNDLEFKQNISNRSDIQNQEISLLRQEQEKTNNLIDKLNSTLIFIIILILSISAGFFIIKLYFSEGFKNRAKNQLGFMKGEKI